MSLRPIAAQWFELVTVHKELARVMECLSRTGAVELEARGRATDRLLFPGLEDELKAHRELARHYENYWPVPAAADGRRPEQLSETLKSARARLSEWTAAADPIIAVSERLAREAADLEQLRAALQSTAELWPDLHLLAGAGPKLQVRLLVLPAGTLLRELPALVLFKPWQTPDGNYVLVVGRTADIGEIEVQLPGLKGRVVPLPAWLPSSAHKAIAAIEERLATLSQQRTDAAAQLSALSQRLSIAAALADIALIEWLNAHAKELRGSERLAWVTGWTSDVADKALRRALDAGGVRYILRFAEAPAGMTPPLVLHNPGWARAFEVFARMLGTPGRNESDPSQILAVIALVNFRLHVRRCRAGRRCVYRRPRARAARAADPYADSGRHHGDTVRYLVRQRVLPRGHHSGAVDAAAERSDHHAGGRHRGGMVIIAIGLLLDAVQMHWRGEAVHWWAQRAGLLIAYAGLLMSPLRREGLLVVAFGAAWFIFGAAALAKRGRLSTLADAAAEFVEQTLRLLVNTVSFARIGAFALAHAGLSVAVIEMASASGRFGYWIVLAVGNVLVIALEGVVVSIQTTRLLLFEFFIRFLTGAGREFKPLPPPAIAKSASKSQT